MGRVNKTELAQLRALDAMHVLHLTARWLKVDPTYKPKDGVTKRVHVLAAEHEFELLVKGAKFYDVRARRGGGGAIDLVMHITNTSFSEALLILAANEISTRL